MRNRKKYPGITVKNRGNNPGITVKNRGNNPGLMRETGRITRE